LDIVGPYQSELGDDVLDRLKKYHWKSCQDMRSEDLEGVDVVIHSAAQADVPMGFSSPRWTLENNTLATVGVLEAAREAKLSKIILASSGNVFGRPLYLPIDEKHPLTCHNPYSASKASQELLFWAYHRSYGLPITIMRNGIVYGPNMRKEIFIYKWLHALLRGQNIILEGGDQTRDPCYSSDTMDAWRRVVEAPTDKVVGEIFQVSYGKELKVRDIATMCVEASRPYLKDGPKIINAPYRPGEEGQREFFSIEKAQRVLGYRPKTELAEGLRLTIDWMRRI
jgi:nucleoside-diphosphate-sugar epimerase